MAAQKFHIGKNGPAVCNAHPERPNGRACRFGEDRHGTQAEVTARWESEQEAQNDGMLNGAQKASEIDAESAALKAKAIERLSVRKIYEPHPIAIEDGIRFEDSDIDVAMRLGESAVSPIGYARFAEIDKDWKVESITSVSRWKLKDGGAGYFKSIMQNSPFWVFEDEYDCSPVSAAVAEVNSYRMAKLLGPGFDELVPETSMLASAQSAGTIQREVPEDHSLKVDFHRSEVLREDYRKAAIFDFVTGNLDRHETNYLFSREENGGSPRARLRLIDNSFSFPAPRHRAHHNASTFANFESVVHEGAPYDSGIGYSLPEGERELRSEELEALQSAREGVKVWIEEGTIDRSRGEATLNRIDFLLEQGKLSSFEDWYGENAN